MPLRNRHELGPWGSQLNGTGSFQLYFSSVSSFSTEEMVIPTGVETEAWLPTGQEQHVEINLPRHMLPTPLLEGSNPTLDSSQFSPHS